MTIEKKVVRKSEPEPEPVRKVVKKVVKKVVRKSEPEPVRTIVRKTESLMNMSIIIGNELMSLLNDEEKKSVSELEIEEGCGNEL